MEPEHYNLSFLIHYGKQAKNGLYSNKITPTGKTVNIAKNPSCTQ